MIHCFVEALLIFIWVWCYLVILRITLAFSLSECSVEALIPKSFDARGFLFYSHLSLQESCWLFFQSMSLNSDSYCLFLSLFERHCLFFFCLFFLRRFFEELFYTFNSVWANKNAKSNGFWLWHRITKKQGANLRLVLVKPHKNSTYNATWNMQLRKYAYEVAIMDLPSCQRNEIFPQVTKNTKFWKKGQCIIDFQ